MNGPGRTPLSQRLSARWSRGWSPTRVGPNEARILFDIAAAAGGALAAMTLVAIAQRRPPVVREWLAALTTTSVFLLVNAAQGLYSRRRTAPVGAKLVGLAGSVAVSGIVAASATGRLFVPVACCLFTLPPVLLARWMAHASRSSAVRLRRLVTDPHSPIAVLGGAGYIGTHTIAELLAHGHRVRVLDRLLYGREPIREFLENPNFALVEGDVTDIARLTEALNGCRAVVHLSGLVGDPACAIDANYTTHTNIVATRMAHEVARALGISRFLFASSCSVYGVADSEVTESSALNPVSHYARTKIESERELLRVIEDDFFVTILRFATVFGHSRRSRFDLVVNLFTAQAMVDGRIRVIGPNQWRPFVHARDLARAVRMALEAPGHLVQSQIFNVGDRRLNHTILDVARVVHAAASRHREVALEVEEQSAADRRNYFVSFERIRRLLGFEASVSLEQGVEEMVERFVDGRYGDYRREAYSNLATTRRAAEEFHDPDEQHRLYAPLWKAES